MCVYPFSLGTGKSTISVLGVGSGTGEEGGDGARVTWGEKEMLKNWVMITQA